MGYDDHDPRPWSPGAPGAGPGGREDRDAGPDGEPLSPAGGVGAAGPARGGGHGDGGRPAAAGGDGGAPYGGQGSYAYPEGGPAWTGAGATAGNARSPWAAAPRPERRPAWWSWLAAAVVGGLLGAAVTWYAAGSGALTGWRPPADPAQQETDATPPPAIPTAQGVDFSAVYERVAPSVVQIVKTARGFNPWLGVVREEGSGSGVVIDEEGHVVTNFHVVENADRLVVVLDDGTQVPADLVATDPSHDLALLRAELPAGKVKPARLGDSDRLRVGEPVMAIGYPFGLPKTATLGVISGLHRNNLEAPNGRIIREVIQTDAPINPGNSGGALVNARGEVIGINTAILSNVRSQPGAAPGSIGIGFAVPINILKRERDQFLAGGTVEHPWLGISGAPVDAETYRARGLAVDHGVQVVEVVPGGPAHEAGLRPARTEGVPLPVGGDVIVAIDGRPVRDVPDILAYLDTRRVGDRVTLQVNREGQTLAIAVTLDAFPLDLEEQ
mgnify:CR=1 FL=1